MIQAPGDKFHPIKYSLALALVPGCSIALLSKEYSSYIIKAGCALLGYHFLFRVVHNIMTNCSISP
eukprot:scaffold74622_cov64-Attheya_sp.AAC.3